MSLLQVEVPSSFNALQSKRTPSPRQAKMVTPGPRTIRIAFSSLSLATATSVCLSCEVGAQIPLEEYTVKTMYSPPEDGSAGGGSYPRVIQVERYPGMEGDLVAIFARRPSIPVFRSTDQGETWRQVSEIQGLGGQPSLYELPQQVGEFPAGTILAAGMASERDPGTTRLDLFASRDGAMTWEFVSTIVEGGRGIYDAAQRAGDSRETPVWEPYLYLDAEGRLVAYYSDERFKDDNFNQLLAHRISEDGGRTWGEVDFDVAISDGQTRPGMSIVTKLPNGRYFMIYEIVSLPGYPLEPRSNPVHFRLSDDGVDFGDHEARGTLIQDRRRQFLWATPYVVWSPYPAPNGTLVASGRGVMREDYGQIGNGHMINQNLGEGFWTLVETPIWYIPGPSGYSHTMIPLGDGREILQIVGVDGQIRYAKYFLPEALPED
jgi:hypothetical protein